MFQFYVSLFLALFFTVVAVFYTAQILRKRRQQIQSVHIGKRYSFHWWNHVTFRSFRTAIWMVCLVRVFWPQLDNYIVVLSSLLIPELQVAGIAMMLCGFILAIIAHKNLGNMWRSGIDTSNTAILVQTGLYAKSRNPAYIGVAISQVGFFFTLPSLFTGCCLLVGLNALYWQTRLEESHLQQQFINDYAQYRNRVPRWL